MQMSMGSSSSNMGQSGPIFKSSFNAQSMKMGLPKPPSMGLKQSNQKIGMTMSNSRFGPSTQVNNSLNQMKTFGFGAAAQ
jgi:hypothetical protein